MCMLRNSRQISDTRVSLVQQERLKDGINQKRKDNCIPYTKPYTLAMVGEMVQNSQSLYSFTFNALIDIHEYIQSHSTTEFTLKKYIYSHLPVYFLFTIIFAHIYEMSLFTFTSYIHIHDRNIHSTFSAHHLCASVSTDCGVRTTDWV